MQFATDDIASGFLDLIPENEGDWLVIKMICGHDLQWFLHNEIDPVNRLTTIVKSCMIKLERKVKT